MYGKTKKGTKPHRVSIKAKSKIKNVDTKATRGRTRKSYGRGGQLIKRTKTFQRGFTMFSQELYAKMPFSETFQLTGSAVTQSAVVNYYYGLNCAYDPRLNVGGGQPLTYDQLRVVYNRYQVYGAYIKIKFWDPTADGAMVGYRIRTNFDTIATNNADITNLGMAPFTKMKELNNTGNQTVNFEGYVDIAKAFSINRQQLISEDSYGSLVSGNPVSQVWLEPFIINRYSSATTCNCTVYIRYYTKFSVPQTLWDI